MARERQAGEIIMNYYDVFGISPTASHEDIIATHKALAKIYHPDVNSSEDAHEKMAMLNEANEVLSDSAKREAYDRGLGRNQQPVQNRDAGASQAAKVKWQYTADDDRRAEKAQLLRKRAEARLKAQEEASVRRTVQSKKKTEDAERRSKRAEDEADRQHVIDVLTSLIKNSDERKRKKLKVNEDRHDSMKVLLSLVKGNDMNLLRMAEEAERKQRIKEILSLVKESGIETE